MLKLLTDSVKEAERDSSRLIAIEYTTDSGSAVYRVPCPTGRVLLMQHFTNSLQSKTQTRTAHLPRSPLRYMHDSTVELDI